MNELALESFINYCDDMKIANESFSNFKAKIVQVFVKLINFIESKIKRIKDYMNKEMVRVVNNFSKERVTALKQVVQHIYGNKK